MQKIMLFDDIRAIDGEEVPATRTETLSFAGEAVELDLTDDTVKEVTERLRELFDLGRPVRRAKAPKAVPPEAAPVKAKTGRTRLESDEYYAGLRAWAASIGEPVGRYETNNGYRYTTDLIRRYAEHLQSGTR